MPPEQKSRFRKATFALLIMLGGLAAYLIFSGTPLVDYGSMAIMAVGGIMMLRHAERDGEGRI
ncbi:MAG: hypothetical protein R3F11_23235 [Verrucomicrobiales bacterium]